MTYPQHSSSPNSYTQNSWGTLRQFFPFLWRENSLRLRCLLLASMAGVVLAKGASAYVPFFFKETIDALSVELSLLSVPVYMIVAYGISRVCAQIFSDIKDALFAPISHHAMRKIAMKIFLHLHGLSLRFHLDRKTGGLSRSIERGTQSVERLLSFVVFFTLPTILEIILVTGVLYFLYGWLYAAIIIGILALYIVITQRITAWRIGIVLHMNETQNKAGTQSVDSLLNYETVQYFGNAAYEAKRYEVFEKQYETAAIRFKYSLGALNTVQGLISALGSIVIMGVAAFQVKAGVLTVGDFVLINTYLLQLYVPLGNLGFTYREIKLALANIADMFALLREPQEVSDLPNAPELTIQGGAVRFQDVRFHYNEDREIIKGLALTVPAGKKLAIVGPSGSGKSTVSRLLFRFYDVTGGGIFIDDQDIRQVSQASLRQAIGIVPQDTVLFNESIGYNIAYGCPSASFDAVQKAAKKAEIHDFIMTLPQQYETPVGERGLKLSGGEKQRVAIARTLLKNPAIFIFDEATSALDTHTEKEIQKSLSTASEGRTTIIIAHRLSTIIDADQIILLRDGAIAESGTHQTLLAAKGLYRAMWERQQGEAQKQTI